MIPTEPPLRTSLVFLVAASIAIVLATWGKVTPLSNDGVQYLEGARSLLAGDGYSTRILYFDEHYAAGRIPVPQTVWPPGTSIGIASLGALGLDLSLAGRILARIAFVFLAPLVFVIAWRLTGSRALAWAAAAWQLSMGEFWMFLATPNSEIPFIAASLAAVALVPSDQGASGRRWTLLFLFAALATLFRYVGLFLFGAMGLVLLADQLRAWRHDRTPSWRALAAPIPGALVIGALLLRNQLLAGDLRGGNTRVVHQSIEGLLVETVRSLIDAFGGATRSDFSPLGIGSIGAGLGLVGLLGLGFVALRDLRQRVTDPRGRHLAGAIACYVAVYLFAIIGTASRTMLTYGTRYLLPVIPLMVCLAVWGAGSRLAPREIPK